MQTETVEVAGTIIACEEQMLVFNNLKWGAFTFPFTKLRRWQDPNFGLGFRQEEPQAAAIRAASEILGHTFAETEWPRLQHEVTEYRQSDADGIWKLYHLHLFGMTLPAKPPTLGAGLQTEWLTVAELRARKPVSSTVRYLLACLEEQGKLPPWKQAVTRSGA
ncbi:MAG: hypothetical protein HZA90_26910 [Verrucomicrobia bacterium]|nr:hypothetical protein [Verrucomicrobiota bacterium]